MAEYIDREIATKKSFRYKLPNGKLSPPVVFVSTLDAIHTVNMTTIRHGKWLKYAPYNSDMLTCSECEHYWIMDGDQYDYRYCPYCGAKMEATDG